jgi:RNA-directed DNA polymerase
VRDADDFVIAVKGERADAEQLREEVAIVLARMGLRLSPDRSRAVHIDDGFDFLGFTIRRMRNEAATSCTYTRPPAKAIASIQAG